MEHEPKAKPPDKDALLQFLTPVVPVPRFGAFIADDRDHGHRYLVARDGTYVEVTRPWLHAIGRIALGVHQTPFGAIEEKVELRCGAIPKKLLLQFVELAKQALPNETSAAFVWNYRTNNWRMAKTAIVSSATPDRVDYVPCSGLADDETVVVDIHSHGKLPAFFSDADNRDDAKGVKVAVVVGKVDDPHDFDLTARVCFFGVHVPLDGLC